MSEQDPDEEPSPSTQFKDRMRGVFEGDIDSQQFSTPEMTVEELSLSVTYKLYEFHAVWDETKDEIDELPEWAEAEHESKSKRSLAKQLVSERTREQFDISGSSLSTTVVAEPDGRHMKVTLVY